MKKESKGICPLCNCNIFVTILHRVDGKPVHETCYIAWAFGLLDRGPSTTE